MPFRAPVFRPSFVRSEVQRRKEYDQARQSTDKRGYDHMWKQLRIEYLAAHPLCECDVHQGKDPRALSEVVHHKAEIATNPDLRLEWTNLQALAKACHDRITGSSTARQP